MAKLLKEYIALSYDKNLIKEAIEKKQPILIKALMQRADSVNQNGRIYSRAILEREVASYQKVIAGGRATGECVPAGTEILTESGWKTIENISAGETILSLNPQTNIIEVQKVSEKVCRFYKDQLVHIWNNKGSIDMVLTKNHQVLLWDRYDKPYDITAFELAEKIKNNDSKVSHSYVRKGGTWVGNSPAVFSLSDKITVPAETWAAFLGIYLAEGHCAGTKGGPCRNVVGITQNPGEKQDKIKELLDRLPFRFELRDGRQFICTDANLYAHLFVLGNSSEKYIPQYAKNWDVGLLRTMFSWMLMGDGRNRKDRDGTIINEYATISEKLSKDVLELMVKLGRGGSISSYQPIDREIEGRMILSEHSSRMNIVHESTTEKGAFLKCEHMHVELIDFDDYVYCVTVPNKTWMMKNNSCLCWTHNCDHPESSIVSLQNVSHIVREIGWMGADVVGVLEILDTPKGKIVQELLAAGVRVGISSRGVGEVIKNEAGNDVVDETFQIIAWDLVSEPSTQNAWLHEGKEVSIDDIRKMIPKQDRISRIVNEILKRK